MHREEFIICFRQRLSERLDECRRNRLFQLYKQPFLNPGTKTIFNMSSSSIAKQLTYLDSQLFNKIEIPEMIWWAADRVEQQCPNIQAMTNHFNNVSYWMRSKILEPESKREREKWFNKFLKVAKVTPIISFLCQLDTSAFEENEQSKRLFGDVECFRFGSGSSFKLATIVQRSNQVSSFNNGYTTIIQELSNSLSSVKTSLSAILVRTAILITN